MDTIFAPATANGKAGVSIIRVSGPNAFESCKNLVGSVPDHHRAALRRIGDNEGLIIDEALVIAFPLGKSFTGEQTVEYHLHGSISVVKAMMENLSRQTGHRLADPGEFTRRALQNNRLDLTQAEGLADLIDAETDAQRRQAQRVLSGAIGELVEVWRRDLIKAVSLLEVTIDFADEEIPDNVRDEVHGLVEKTHRSLLREAEKSHVSERIRDGFEIAIIGPPNIGKSTLLNALAGRDAAITSEIAGTTRDVIEVRMDLAGYPVTLLDTAGLRATEDTVERLGIERARNRATTADIRVILVENNNDTMDIDIKEGDVVCQGKADLQTAAGFGVSGKTGFGIDRLLDRLVSDIQQRTQSAGTVTRERHRTAILNCAAVLGDVRANVQNDSIGVEILSEDLRKALYLLETLLGRVGVEDILDQIFSSFCLGK